jgi:hypothetical protein
LAKLTTLKLEQMLFSNDRVLAYLKQKSIEKYTESFVLKA